MILGSNPKIKQISNHNKNAEIYKHVILWVWKFLHLRNYIGIIIPSLNSQKYLQKSKLGKWDKNPYALIFFRNPFTRQILWSPHSAHQTERTSLKTHLIKCPSLTSQYCQFWILVLYKLPYSHQRPHLFSFFLVESKSSSAGSKSSEWPLLIPATRIFSMLDWKHSLFINSLS